MEMTRMRRNVLPVAPGGRRAIWIISSLKMKRIGLPIQLDIHSVADLEGRSYHTNLQSLRHHPRDIPDILHVNVLVNVFARKRKMINMLTTQTLHLLTRMARSTSTKMLWALLTLKSPWNLQLDPNPNPSPSSTTMESHTRSDSVRRLIMLFLLLWRKCLGQYPRLMEIEILVIEVDMAR